MERKDIDEFNHALKITFDFYNKEVNEAQRKIWWRSLADQNIQDVVTAFKEYPMRGRYAPKPVEIIEIINEAKEHRTSRSAGPKEKLTTDCPPEIARAWSWFVRMVASTGTTFGEMFDPGDLDPDQQERYIHIVNHEARKYNRPDAIPDEFKLKEVWG